MTPCEKLGYKVGDRFEVVGGGGSAGWPVGTIVILHHDDGSRDPAFRKEGEEWKHDFNGIHNVRPLKTEAEKRGAKFGTMGVVKATGERCVYIDESLVLPGYWEIDVKGKADRWHRKPSEIRLDHEPEYKEIPFSEATDEQRMDVGNLVHVDGDTVTQIFKFDNGAFVYTLEGYNWTGTHTGRLTVRVPA